MSIPSFPKVFAIGTRHTYRIFDNPVEITEKIDGSQFSFGVIDGVLHMRSKGATVTYGDGNKMFHEAAEYVHGLFEEDKLPPNLVFHGEYLQKPKHNSLKYATIPKNHIMIYAVRNLDNDTMYDQHSIIRKFAYELDLEAVPLIYEGMAPEQDTGEWMLEMFKDKESVLGGAMMEGIVVKNYEICQNPNDLTLINGSVLPVLVGKYVSEAFKETHKLDWTKANPSKQEQFWKAFKSEARWEKAIQHLKEKDVLVGEPKDIGPLMKEIMRDIEEEEIDNIKEALWRINRDEVFRIARNGFPEWYKERLVQEAFDE